MKMKLMLGLAVAAAALGLSACDNSKAATTDTQTKGSGDKEVLYSGILPSADAEGTVYTLKLEFDDDHNYTDGDFTMVENTIVADTTAVSGMKEAATSYTEGDFKKESKEVDGTKVDYIRLVPDAKDSMGAPSAASMYFVMNADGSLTMVGADLTMPVMPAMYTLTVK